MKGHLYADVGPIWCSITPAGACRRRRDGGSRGRLSIYKGLWDVSRIGSDYKFCIQYTKRFSLSRENLDDILCVCKYAKASKFLEFNSL